MHACVHFVRASKGRSEKREFPCDGPPIWSQSVHGREERERRKRVDVAATRRRLSSLSSLLMLHRLLA